MMRRLAILGTILAGLLIHVMFFPSKECNEAFSRQLCLDCGANRELRETFVEKKKTNEEELLLENFISSYTVALNGPCVTHNWATYSGGSFEYRSGLAYYFSLKSNTSYSGSSEAFIPSGFPLNLKYFEKFFAKLYKENPELLQRILKNMFNTIKMNKEEKFDELVSILADNSVNIKKFKSGLDDFERKP